MHIVNQALYFLGSTYTDAFVTKSRLLQVNLFQKHLFLHQNKRLFIELQVQYMKIASSEHS